MQKRRIKHRGVAGVGFAAALLTAGQAGATAPASPDVCPPPVHVANCSAPAPAAGVAFAGPVLQVIDASTVCVALGPLPTQWVRVDLADTPSDGTRSGLMAAVFAQDVTCLSAGPAGVGVRAVCLSGGVSVGLLASRPEIRAAAGSWR